MFSLHVYIYVCVPHAAWKSEEGNISLRTAVMDDYKPPYTTLAQLNLNAM